MTILTDTRISDCCGATEQTDMPFNSDGGFCSDCKDHCEYVEIEDDAETPVIYQDPIQLGWDRVMIAFTVLAITSFVAGYVSAAMTAVEGVR